MSIRVAFVVAGAQKCGTSLLRKYLAQHPGIGISRKREVHFFDEDAYFQNPSIDYADYHAHYRHCPSGACLGDVTPAYLFWQPAAARIRAYNPQMKTLVVLRNPVARAFSHWNMMRQKGLEPLDFKAALEAEPARAQAALPGQDKAFSYMARGHYAAQLRHWFSVFPRQQCHVLRMEDLAYRHQPTMAAVFDFLGLDPDVAVQSRFANVRPYEVALQPAQRQYLQQLYRPGIRDLEQLLDADFSAWLE